MATTIDSDGNELDIGPGTAQLRSNRTYTFTNTTDQGIKYVGEWKDGLPWTGTRYDKDDNVLQTWTNGIWTETYDNLTDE